MRWRNCNVIHIRNCGVSPNAWMGCTLIRQCTH